LLQLGRTQEAINDLQRAVRGHTVTARSKPIDPFVINKRGRSYYLLKQYHDAKADFEHAIELFAEYAEAHASLGLVHLALGCSLDAVPYFIRAIQLHISASSTMMALPTRAMVSWPPTHSRNRAPPPLHYNGRFFESLVRCRPSIAIIQWPRSPPVPQAMAKRKSLRWHKYGDMRTARCATGLMRGI